MKPFHQDSREAHHTKRGPGRKHSQGPRGRSRPHGRGFKGATFSVPAPAEASQFLAQSRQAALEAFLQPNLTFQRFVDEKGDKYP